MRQDIKERWVSALREPDREQGTGQLRDDKGRQCCLDVLCELAVTDGIIAPPVLRSADYVGTEHGVYTYSEFNRDEHKVNGIQWEVLPGSVIGWSGVVSSNPEVA